MGFVHVTVQVSSPSNPQEEREIELLVDTGAILSVIPRQMLEERGVPALGSRRFRGFGGVPQRDTAALLIRYNGDVTGTTAIFGEADDTPILGVTALGSLGYQVDPTSGELKPTDLLLL